jgi:alpha-tubulin suppressor-like RCC1 family protein
MDRLVFHFIICLSTHDISQLGLGSKVTMTAVPVAISELAGLSIAAVSCGSYHSFAITTEKEIFSWGVCHSCHND